MNRWRRLCSLQYAVVSLTLLTGCSSVRVSGRVVDQFGEPVAGAKLATATANVTTGADGTYAVPVPFGWSGILRLIPFLAAAETIPDNGTRLYAALTADIAEQNFRVTWKMVSISGQVNLRDPATGAMIPFGGVMLRAAGKYNDNTRDYSTSAVTGPDGKYSLSVPYGWSGTVTPTVTETYEVVKQ